MSQFLDKTGLTYFWGKIKTLLANKADKTHSHDAATTSANGFMTSAMVTKLNGIATGANKITVDSALSTTSTNPVQNKIVTNNFISISETLGEHEAAISALQSGSGGSGSNITVDSALSDTSTNPVQNKVIKQAIGAVQSEVYDVADTLSGEIGILYDMTANTDAKVTKNNQFKLIQRTNLTTTNYLALSGILSTYLNTYSEFMIVVRTVSSSAINIGIANDTSASSTTGFLCSKSVTGTAYNKILLNVTDEGCWAWDVGGSFGWDANKAYSYFKYTSSGRVQTTLVIYGR
jgi:hypothetical protein